MLLLQGCNLESTCHNSKEEDPDQMILKQSDLGIHCLSRHFLHSTSIQNFRTITILLEMRIESSLG